MSNEGIEREISELKQRVTKLENRSRPVAKETWHEAAGTQPDDEVFREAVRLGTEWRGQANAQGK